MRFGNRPRTRFTNMSASQRFTSLLSSQLDDDALTAMGQLMYGSHESYSACGLGSDGTDLLVELWARSAGAKMGLYGAKITGGGSGGAVAILGRAEAGPAVAGVVHEYRRRTGATRPCSPTRPPGLVNWCLWAKIGL